jgi:alkylhydroperoxidase/carboxymuconolactone decarboxylase family protein YurZ
MSDRRAGLKAEQSRALLERIERERGVVRAWPRLMAEADPQWMELWHDLTMHVLEGTGHLSRKTKELMLVAVDAASFYDRGVRVHTRGALAAGATEAELIETLEVVSIVNPHGLTSMVEIVHDEVRAFDP